MTSDATPLSSDHLHTSFLFISTLPRLVICLFLSNRNSVNDYKNQTKPCASITLAEEKLSFQAPGVCYVMLWVPSLI